ncbi:MAG: hypothetical protein ACD_8C00148G0001 [uncultured bacterium]|nr:MAG: hypothetical protein ACD_8C00148G0001 [uncultured bacterium]
MTRTTRLLGIAGIGLLIAGAVAYFFALFTAPYHYPQSLTIDMRYNILLFAVCTVGIALLVIFWWLLRVRREEPLRLRA